MIPAATPTSGLYRDGKLPSDLREKGLDPLVGCGIGGTCHSVENRNMELLDTLQGLGTPRLYAQRVVGIHRYAGNIRYSKDMTKTRQNERGQEVLFRERIRFLTTIF